MVNHLKMAEKEIMFVTHITTIPHVLQTLEYKEIENMHQCGTRKF
jgi:hypothetical protein